jgi:hypothetical protein
MWFSPNPKARRRGRATFSLAVTQCHQSVTYKVTDW